MTIFGLVIKNATYSTDNITAEDPFIPKTVTLRLDMPNDEDAHFLRKNLAILNGLTVMIIQIIHKIKYFLLY